MYAMILLSKPGPEKLRSLRCCFSAGEALPKSVSEAWLELTGIDIWQGYGSTEVMTFVIGSKPPRATPGKTGWTVPPYEIEILDAEGRPVPDKVPGHLVTRGPSIMAEYLNEPEWTRRAFTPDGFLFTGDMAEREEGVYTILGRMDDMFKAGGLWIPPIRVEEALLSHPAVARCAVTGGMAAGFTLIQAHVVPGPGAAPGPELAGELRRHAAQGLPDFMVPSEILFRESLPMTPTGKVQRYKLRTRGPSM